MLRLLLASPVTEDLKPKRKIFPPKKDVLASLVHTKKGSHRTLRWGYVFSDERSASFESIPLGVTPLGLRSTDPHWYLRRKEFSTPLLAFRRERYVTAYGRFTVLAVQQDRMDARRFMISDEPGQLAGDVPYSVQHFVPLHGG